MGMFDDVKYEMDCPKCGARVTGFQSKAGPCVLLTLEFWEVSNFYSNCPNCNVWILFNRKAPGAPLPIEAYEMTIEEQK